MWARQSFEPSQEGWRVLGHVPRFMHSWRNDHPKLGQ